MATAALPYNVASVVASVTLTGTSFAPTDSTVTAVVALADCATSSWTTATSVACVGMPGAGDVGTVGVSVATVVGTSSTVFSFDGSCFSLEFGLHSVHTTVSMVLLSWSTQLDTIRNPGRASDHRNVSVQPGYLHCERDSCGLELFANRSNGYCRGGSFGLFYNQLDNDDVGGMHWHTWRWCCWRCGFDSRRGRRDVQECFQLRLFFSVLS